MTFSMMMMRCFQSVSVHRMTDAEVSVKRGWIQSAVYNATRAKQERGNDLFVFLVIV